MKLSILTIALILSACVDGTSDRELVIAIRDCFDRDLRAVMLCKGEDCCIECREQLAPKIDSRPTIPQCDKPLWDRIRSGCP